MVQSKIQNALFSTVHGKPKADSVKAASFLKEERKRRGNFCDAEHVCYVMKRDDVKVVVVMQRGMHTGCLVMLETWD
jgi:hypothetical protein